MKKRGLGLCISALLLAACSNDEPELPQNSEPDQVTESAPRPEPELQKLAIGSPITTPPFFSDSGGEDKAQENTPSLVQFRLAQSDEDNQPVAGELVEYRVMSTDGQQAYVIGLAGRSAAIDNEIRFVPVDEQGFPALIYSDGVHREKVISTDFMPSFKVTLDEDGSLTGQIYAGGGTSGVAVKIHHTGSDLSQTNTANAVALSSSAATTTTHTYLSESLNMPQGALGYRILPVLEEDLFLTWWGKGGKDGRCDSGPGPSEVVSCNLTFRKLSDGAVREPIKSLGSLFFGNNSWPHTDSESLTLSIHGQSVLLQLSGSIYDETGNAVLGIKQEGNITPYTGTWDYVTEPFEHIQLKVPGLPASLSINPSTNLFFMEQEGFVRLGWTVPAGEPVTELFGLAPDAILFNERGALHIIEALVDGGEAGENHELR